MSNKLNLPLAVFTVEAVSITILTTLGFMTTTLVVISTVVLIALVWNRGKSIQTRSEHRGSIRQ